MTDRKHRFLDPLPPPLEAADVFARLLGHQQVTDAYLLGVAARHGAVFLTLDRRIVPPESSGARVEIVTP